MINPSFLPLFASGISSTVWNKLGVNYNYNGAGSNAAADFAYLRSLGFQNIRLNVFDYRDSADFSAWRTIVQQALNAGFRIVIYGFNNPRPAANTWANYVSTLSSEATWAQGINDARLWLSAGNEEEFAQYLALSSLTQSVGVATAVSSVNHEFVTSDSVTIAGASPSNYNGTYTITKVNNTTFTYSVAGNPSSPATVSASPISTAIVASSMPLATILTNIKSLATTLKAIYTVGKITHAAPGTQPNVISSWSSGGIGNLDSISFNLYDLNGNTDFDTFLATALAGGFGQTFFLSEFGPDVNGIVSSGLTATQWATTFLHELQLLKNNAVSLAFIYNFMDAANIFGMKNTNGTFIQAWQSLLSGV